MIYGDTIYLREILKEDIDEAYSLCSDSEVLKYNAAVICYKKCGFV